jgi:hypothetical protein
LELCSLAKDRLNLAQSPFVMAKLVSQILDDGLQGLKLFALLLNASY